MVRAGARVAEGDQPFTFSCAQDIMLVGALTANAGRKGAIGMMNSIPVDAEPDVESELVDLGAVPLTVLRELDHAALHRAMRRVVERTRALRVIRASNGAQGGGGGRGCA